MNRAQREATLSEVRKFLAQSPASSSSSAAAAAGPPPPPSPMGSTRPSALQPVSPTATAQPYSPPASSKPFQPQTPQPALSRGAPLSPPPPPGPTVAPLVIIFDLETSGLSPDNNRIIEIATMDAADPTKFWSALVNPGRINLSTTVRYPSSVVYSPPFLVLSHDRWPLLLSPKGCANQVAWCASVGE